MTWINFVHTRLFLNEDSEQAANAIMDTAEGPKMKHWPGHIFEEKKWWWNMKKLAWEVDRLYI